MIMKDGPVWGLRCGVSDWVLFILCINPSPSCVCVHVHACNIHGMSTDSDVRWLHVGLWLGFASHSEASWPESFWGFSCLCLSPSSPGERLDHRDTFLWLAWSELWSSNSGPHTCTAIVSSNELAPQLSLQMLMQGVLGLIISHDNRPQFPHL